MIQTFLDLPTSLSAAILCNWLDLKSVCRLDSAACEKSVRTTLLSLLQCMECVGQLYARNTLQLIWMNKRLIKSDKFVMIDHFSEDECRKLLQRSGRYVQTFRQLCLVSQVALLHLVAQYCNNVCFLRITIKEHVAENIALIRANKNLRELSIRSCAPLLVRDISLPKLELLKLDGFHIDDATVVTLAKATTRLMFLSISCASITAGGLIETARLCPQLRYFKAPDLPDIDNTMLKLMPLWASLEHIRLSGCQSLTDAGINAVALHVKGLRSIKMTYSPSLTNACLQSLAKYQHHTLEIFIVRDSYYFPLTPVVLEDNKQTFNASAVAKFREICTKLRVFEWERSFDFLDAGVAGDAIPYVTTADRVTFLTFGQVNDAVLHTIAQHCAQLQVLNLSDVCYTANFCSDAMFLELAEKCRLLNTINVPNPSQRSRLRKLLSAHSRITIDVAEYCLSQHSLDFLYRKNM